MTSSPLSFSSAHTKRAAGADKVDIPVPEGSEGRLESLQSRAALSAPTVDPLANVEVSSHRTVTRKSVADRFATPKSLR